MDRPFGSFSLATLGCKVNQYDTQSVRESLESLGLVEVPFADGADLAIVNTCAVTAEAVRKSRVLVRRARRFNPASVVAVTGCAVSEQPESFAAQAGVALAAGRTSDLVARLRTLAAPPQAEEPGDDEPADVPDAEVPRNRPMTTAARRSPAFPAGRCRSTARRLRRPSPDSTDTGGHS